MKKREIDQTLARWEGFFMSLGVERAYIDVYLEYVSNLIRKDLPPIFDLKHLGALLGLKVDFLSAAIYSAESFYRNFEIPKRSGGQRQITAPYPSLKYVQKWIYRNILSKIKVHGCVHGFVDHRSILTNAKVHIGQQCLLKLDLKDFFPSISMDWVVQVFKTMGYETQVAFSLASLCCYQGSLPQGSPASPAISNIVAMHLDRRLYRLAKKFKLNYSRYADDIAFSGERICPKFITYVNDIIEDCGFSVNRSKIRLYKEHGNKILTGVSLSTGQPRIPRDYRRRLQKDLHYIDKYGIKGHMMHNKIRDPRYLESIIGRLGFWLMIEPDNTFAQGMMVKFREAKLASLEI